MDNNAAASVTEMQDTIDYHTRLDALRRMTTPSCFTGISKMDVDEAENAILHEGKRIAYTLDLMEKCSSHGITQRNERPYAYPVITYGSPNDDADNAKAYGFTSYTPDGSTKEELVFYQSTMYKTKLRARPLTLYTNGKEIHAVLGRPDEPIPLGRFFTPQMAADFLYDYFTAEEPFLAWFDETIVGKPKDDPVWAKLRDLRRIAEAVPSCRAKYESIAKLTKPAE